MPEETRNYLTRPIGPNESFYDILDLTPDADIIEIRRAYKKLSLVNHPDKHHQSAEEEYQKIQATFKKIVEIHEILTDSAKKAAYDRELTGRQFDRLDPEKADAPDALQKEEWVLFEQFVRKLLSKINPSKEHIYLGTPGGISWSDLYRQASFEIGAASKRNRPTNLTLNEREEFVSFIQLMDKRLRPTSNLPTAIGFTVPKDLNPEYDDTMIYGGELHSRLRYSTPVVKELIRFHKEQPNGVTQLLKEYSEVLNHKIYLNKIIKEQFSAVGITIKTDKSGALLFYFYSNSFADREGYKAQWDLFTKWMKDNYNISITHDSELSIPCKEIISILEKKNININEVVTQENEKREIIHSIDLIKYYIEERQFEVIDEELKKIKDKGIAFPRLEQLTAENKKSSLLMSALRYGAPLHIVQNLVKQGSSLTYTYTDGGYETKVFLQAVRYSSADVVAYLYEQLGNPDLNQLSLQDASDESVLRTAIKYVSQSNEFIFDNTEKHKKRIKVVDFLISKGASLNPNDKKFTEQRHSDLAKEFQKKIDKLKQSTLASSNNLKTVSSDYPKSNAKENAPEIAVKLESSKNAPTETTDTSAVSKAYQAPEIEASKISNPAATSKASSSASAVSANSPNENKPEEELNPVRKEARKIAAEVKPYQANEKLSPSSNNLKTVSSDYPKSNAKENAPEIAVKLESSKNVPTETTDTSAVSKAYQTPEIEASKISNPATTSKASSSASAVRANSPNENKPEEELNPVRKEARKIAAEVKPYQANEKLSPSQITQKDKKSEIKIIGELVDLCEKYENHLNDYKNPADANLLERKKQILAELKSSLTKSGLNSQGKIERFKSILTQENTELLAKRNDANAGIKFLEAVAHILTLGIYSKITKGTFQFWKSHGQAFKDSAKELIEDENKESLNKKM